MALPVLTPEQRADALRKAVAARAARATALGAIRSGSVTLADILADTDSPLQKAKVRQVLRAIPRVGAVTADKMLAEIGIDPKRRIGGLGDRQRAALVERLTA